MKYIVYKDKIKRGTVLNNEYQRLLVKSVVFNRNIPISTRNALNIYLSRYKRNSSITRIKNRCVISGNSKSIIRKFKISRHMLRKYIHNGYVPGIIKSSW